MGGTNASLRVSSLVWPIEGRVRLTRRKLTGNANRIRVMASLLCQPASLIPASLRRPVWACRSPSSYPQRYQKSSSRDSFSFLLPCPWLLWLRALAGLVGLVPWRKEDDSDRTGPV